MNEPYLEVYSVGLVSMSLCTDIEDTKEIEKVANEKSPSGVSHPWTISDETHFHSGETMPTACNKTEGRKHYLLHC